MPSVNFQKRFAGLVESGAKRQTIRALRRDGRDHKPGDSLYLFTGMRTRNCRRLVVRAGVDVDRVPVANRPYGHVVRCTSADRISIDDPVLCERASCVKIGSLELLSGEAERVARADGFISFEELLDFVETEHDLPFEGVLSHW